MLQLSFLLVIICSVCDSLRTNDFAFHTPPIHHTTTPFSSFALRATTQRNHQSTSPRNNDDDNVQPYPYRRVVVTGIGITSPLGNTIDEVTNSLYESKSGITFSEDYASLGMKSQVWGKPKLSSKEIDAIIPKDIRPYCTDSSVYAYVSIVRAIKDSGLREETYQHNPRTALIVGQCGPSGVAIREAVGAMNEGIAEGMDWSNEVGSYAAMRSMGSQVSAVLSTSFHIEGPSFSIASACSTGAHCIGVAFNKIQTDKADIAFCGAGDEFNSWELATMFDSMGVLSSSHNDDPTVASRPFDEDRDGFVASAGGGILVLEELEHAKKRGAKIYAEISGYGATSDGFDMVAPSGEGGKRAMRLAINEANQIGGVRPVEYINTHGTSTPVGDGVELTAIRTLFEEFGYQPFVGSTKSLSGHALGAAGVHEVIYTILMMKNDFMAKSANIDNLIEEADDMNILTEKVDGKIHRALSNSFGFGGTNCVLALDAYESNE